HMPMVRPPPRPTRFPYTTLFRSVSKVEAGGPAERAGMKIGDRILTADGQNVRYLYEAKRSTLYKQPGDTITFVVQRGEEQKRFEDRKSTRLNSSHSQISYAVFCL